MRRRVFLVDDSPLMLELYSELIEMQPDLALAGTATSAEEALRDIPESAADLALVDVSLPGLNGIELVGRLGAEVPGLPCILFSAHSVEIYEQRAREVGALGYIEKGDPAALLSTLRGALDGSGDTGHGEGL
jgi:DNA-binding NarL/FixJ family response regulator